MPSKRLTIEQEIDIFLQIAQGVVALSTWYKIVDPRNMTRMQEVSLLMKEALDSRVAKFEKGTSNGS